MWNMHCFMPCFPATCQYWRLSRKLWASTTNLRDLQYEELDHDAYLRLAQAFGFTQEMMARFEPENDYVPFSWDHDDYNRKKHQ